MGKTAKHIAYVIATKGFKDETVFGGNSMDFADEEGFDHHDGAKHFGMTCDGYVNSDGV